MNKRVLTEETYQSGSVASNQSHPSTPTDLTAALRNVGMRARKNVTEGYATTRFHASASSSPTTPVMHGTPLFRSANDTLRDVYSHTPYQSPYSSPSKKRARPEMGMSHSDDEHNADSDTDMNIEPTETNSSYKSINRVVKPLRGARRALMQTQSLPINAFRFSGGSTTQTVNASPLNTVGENVDDDWSANAFDSPSTAAFQPMPLE